jgi:uncharacterized membrane protein YdjX (TVP38/TMEM64 family)
MKMKKKSPIIHIVLTFAIILTVVFIVNKFDLVSKFKLDEVVRYVRHRGRHAELTFLALAFLKSFIIVVPAAVFSVAGGMLFGAIKGFVLNLMGLFISATTVFFTARFLGKGFLNKMLKGRILKLDKQLECNGFKFMFLIRMIPIFPYDLLSLAAGVSSIRYRDFILGSVLGVIPELFCYSLIIAGIGRNHHGQNKLIYLIIAIIILIVIFIYKKNSNMMNLDED